MKNENIDLSDVLDSDELMKAITELVEFMKAENEKYLKQPLIDSKKALEHSGQQP
jgi:hypothetical protein